MANETCKFCESSVVGPPTDFDHGCGTKTTFECCSRYYANRRGAVDWVRCENCKDRELAALRNQLAAVTAERDKWMQNFDDVAHRLADLQQRIDAAPVFHVPAMALDGVQCLLVRGPVEGYARVRLVRDDQPEETVK